MNVLQVASANLCLVNLPAGLPTFLSGQHCKKAVIASDRDQQLSPSHLSLAPRAEAILLTHSAFHATGC